MSHIAQYHAEHFFFAFSPFSVPGSTKGPRVGARFFASGASRVFFAASSAALARVVRRRVDDDMSVNDDDDDDDDPTRLFPAVCDRSGRRRDARARPSASACVRCHGFLAEGHFLFFTLRAAEKVWTSVVTRGEKLQMERK